MNTCVKSSKIEIILRGLSGGFLLASLLLTRYHSPNWEWFSFFIAINLLQSAFTNWCPMMTILRRGFKIEG